METILQFVVSLGVTRRHLLSVLNWDSHQEVRLCAVCMHGSGLIVQCASGSAGQLLSGVLIAGPEILMIEYTCTGSETFLSDCLNSSLATCNSRVAAAISCQGTSYDDHNSCFISACACRYL